MIDDEQLVSELIDSDLIGRSLAKRGLELAANEERTFYDVVIRRNLVDERQVVDIASDLLNVPCIHLDDVDIDAATAGMLSADLAAENRVVPIEMIDDEGVEVLKLGMTDPIDVMAMDEIASHTGVDIQPVLVGPVDLEQTIDRLYGDEGTIELDVDDVAIEFDDEDDDSAIELGEPIEFDDEIDFDDDEDDDSAIELDDGPVDFSQSDDEDDAFESAPDDSWAAMFDEADDEDDDPPEDDENSGGRPPSLADATDRAPDSGPISREMRDRPPTGVMELVDEDDDSAGTSNHGPAFSQHPAMMDADGDDETTGTQIGRPAELGDWELDEALEKSGAARLRNDSNDESSGNESSNNATQVGGPVDPDEWDLDDDYYEDADDDGGSESKIEVADDLEVEVESEADDEEDADADESANASDQTQIGVPGDIPDELEFETDDEEAESESADDEQPDDADNDDEDDDGGVVPSSLRQALDRAKKKKGEKKKKDAATGDDEPSAPDEPESDAGDDDETPDEDDDSDGPSSLGRIAVKTKRVRTSSSIGEIVEKRSDRERKKESSQAPSVEADNQGLDDDETSAYDEPSTREMNASDLSSLASASGDNGKSPAVALPDDVDSDRLLRGLIELLVDRDLLEASDIEQLLDQI